MKVTDKELSGSSFHDVTVSATPNELIKLFGEPQYECNDGTDKVNMEWALETTEGHPITLYDWKEYRAIGEDELIEWHVGGFDFMTTALAKEEIESLLVTV